MWLGVLRCVIGPARQPVSPANRQYSLNVPRSPSSPRLMAGANSFSHLSYNNKPPTRSSQFSPLQVLLYTLSLSLSLCLYCCCCLQARAAYPCLRKWRHFQPGRRRALPRIHWRRWCDGFRFAILIVSLIVNAAPPHTGLILYLCLLLRRGTVR